MPSLTEARQSLTEARSAEQANARKRYAEILHADDGADAEELQSIVALLKISDADLQRDQEIIEDVGNLEAELEEEHSIAARRNAVANNINTLDDELKAVQNRIREERGKLEFEAMRLRLRLDSFRAQKTRLRKLRESRPELFGIKPAQPAMTPKPAIDPATIDRSFNHDRYFDKHGAERPLTDAELAQERSGSGKARGR